MMLEHTMNKFWPQGYCFMLFLVVLLPNVYSEIPPFTSQAPGVLSASSSQTGPGDNNKSNEDDSHMLTGTSQVPQNLETSSPNANDFTTDKDLKKMKLLLGVYSEDPSWERIVASTLNRMYKTEAWRNYLNIEIVYLTHKFRFDLQGIMAANESLRIPPMTVVLGPYNPTLQLVAEDLNLPYLVTTLPNEMSYHYSPYAFMMRPSHKVVHKAAIDVINKYGWTEVAILYDNPQGLQFIGDLMEATRNVLRIKSWQLQSDIDDKQLKDQLLKLRIDGQTKICLVCQPKLITRIFAMALKFSMLSHLYSWMVVTLNPYTTNYNDYNETQVNFTTFEPHFENSENTQVLLFKNSSFLDSILAYQTLSTVTNAAYEYVKQESKRGGAQRCGDNDGFGCNSFIRGTDIKQLLYQDWPNSNGSVVTFQNGTNELSVVHIDTVRLNRNGLEPMGHWRSHLPDKLRLEMPPTNNSIYGPHRFPKKKFQIVTILDPPFVMYAPDHENKKGKAKFKGFLLDLMEEIANRLEFEYEVYEVEDKSYGSKNEDGTWNGMINDLMTAKADMCIGAISITSEREQVVDFTKPFMQKSYNLLIKKPDVKTSIFQFLWPLSRDVWILTIGSILMLGFILFVMDRLSPNSSDNKFRFNMKESIWFIYGTLVGAGTEMVPRTISGRLLTGSWWFFALILISSYTANLAAFLTVTKIDTPIRTLSDLVKQTAIKYGTVKNTNAHMFFRTSKVEVFQDMWRFIQLNQGLVDNSTEGLQRVQNGDYAFVWDTPVNKYMTMKHCDVMTVGEPFDQKGYGIGVPRGVSYRDDLTMKILSINEEGIIQQLENKWWSASECDAFQDTSTARTKELNFYNVAGVFLVLAVGATLALITSIIEYFVHKARKKAKKKKSYEKDCEKERELQTALYTETNSVGPTITRQKSWMFRT